MPKAPPITDDERARVIELARGGMSRNGIAKQLGRSSDSVTKIAKAHEQATGEILFDRKATKAATAAKQADNAAKRAQLAQGMLDDALRLREQMFADVVYKQPMVVSDGKDAGSHIETAEVDCDEPTFKDKRDIAQAVAVLAKSSTELERTDTTTNGPGRGLLERLVESLDPATS